VEEFMRLLTRPAALLSLLSFSVIPAQAAMTPPPASGPGGKVVITSCLVMFALKSRGSSATNAGMFNNESRSEVTVTKIYELAGFDTTAFQRVTDEMCGGAPAALTAAGYEVVTAGVTDHYAWKDAQERGQASPQEQKANGTEYRVYAQTGVKIVDPTIVGGMAIGRLTWDETTLGNNFGAKPVNIIYTVDFAAIEAAGRRTRLQDQNTASVSATVNLTVGATVISYDASEDNVRCNPLGASREARAQPYCALRKNQRFEGTYSTDSATSRRFPEPIVSVEEITSTAGSVAMGAANALALMAGSRRQKLDKFTVTVDPAKYEASAVAGAAEVLTGAMRWIHEPETRPRRGRR
jgi:hypothetical protein